jgi:hypothetical protein
MHVWIVNNVNIVVNGALRDDCKQATRTGGRTGGVVSERLNGHKDDARMRN